MREVIEAVTVCSGYAGELRAVAPHNRPHLDRWVVVTSSDDKDTQRVCRDYNIETVVTAEAKRDGPFSKGRLINRGLAMLGQQDWILHLDADIALPTDFRTALDEAHLDESKIYGCDRLNVTSPEAWARIERQGLRARETTWGVRVHRPDTEAGMRVANVEYGYTPIGFFQLWHGSKGVRYPIRHGTAARTDVQHSLQWDTRDRVHLPALVVWHLESERTKMGANWAGRTTKPFTKRGDYET